MKRIAVWAFYGVGAIAIGYLALYAYAMFTGRELVPGDPIHIFRKPDARNYSFRTVTILTSLRANGSRECAPDDRFREAIHRATRRKNGLLRRGVYHRARTRRNPLAPRNDEFRG